MTRQSIAGVALIAIAFVAISWGLTAAQNTPPEQTVMQRKLLHAQKILEALAKADFEGMEKSADGLIKCINDATWRINDTEKYLMHSDQFRRDILELKKAAAKKNLEAAALAYTDMTRDCVRCHQHLRDQNR